MRGEGVYAQFERLIAELFTRRGFAVQREAHGRRGRPIDIVALQGLASLPIEVKLSSGAQPTLSQLRNWASQTAELQEFADLTRPLLVVGASIQDAHRSWISDEFNIDIWDRDKVLAEAGDLGGEISDLLLRAADERKSRWSGIVPSTPAPLPASVVQVVLGPEDDEPEAAGPPRGGDLASRLAAIKPGRRSAQAYEEVCRDIIDYLFGEDLRDPRTHKRSEDSLHVFDIIYRVTPKHPFWTTLTRDFRARVVLFECKNYSKPITPMQVFTTERYLSANALRPVCFVLSRQKPHAQTVRAAMGSMRESGKLLVFLADADLVQMLEIKDAQLLAGGDEVARRDNDPTEVLDQKIYDFISAMSH